MRQDRLSLYKFAPLFVSYDMTLVISSRAIHSGVPRLQDLPTLIGLLGHSPGIWMSKAMTPPGRDPLHGGFQFILELKGRFGGMRARPARWRR